jgi:Domain of unknown function (DUF4272)
MANRSHEIGGLISDRLRTEAEIIDRTLTLSAVIAAANGVSADEVRDWLNEEHLESSLTKRELAFLLSAQPSNRHNISFSWQAECLYVLLWALGRIPEMSFPNDQVSSDTLLDILPPYADETVAEFRKKANLRSENELFDLAANLQNLHAFAIRREIQPDYRPNTPAIDLEVVQERHYAANWLVGYSGQEWDNISTDT